MCRPPSPQEKSEKGGREGGSVHRLIFVEHELQHLDTLKLNLCAVKGLNEIPYMTLNVISFHPTCNEVLNVITFCLKCNKLVSLTFSLKNYDVMITSSMT